MKKILLVFLCIVYVTGNSIAQTKFGLVGGINLSTFGGNDAKFSAPIDVQGILISLNGPNTRTGFAFGAFADIPVITKNLFFSPALLYSMKGAKYNGTVTYLGIPVAVDLTMKYDYLDLPLMIKYVFPTDVNVKPFLLAGPSVGILLSSKAEATAEAMGRSSETATDITNQNGLELGLTVGGGVGIAIDSHNLLLGVRYSLGLTSVDNSPGVSANIKNNYFNFFTGYEF